MRRSRSEPRRHSWKGFAVITVREERQGSKRSWPAGNVTIASRFGQIQLCENVARHPGNCPPEPNLFQKGSDIGGARTSREQSRGGGERSHSRILIAAVPTPDILSVGDESTARAALTRTEREWGVNSY